MKGRPWSPLVETTAANAKSAVTRVGKTQLEESSVWIYVRPSCVSSDDSEWLSPAALSLEEPGGAFNLFKCLWAGCEV